jgi:hypothetical protein
VNRASAGSVFKLISFTPLKKSLTSLSEHRSWPLFLESPLLGLLETCDLIEANRETKIRLLSRFKKKKIRVVGGGRLTGRSTLFSDQIFERRTASWGLTFERMAIARALVAESL